LLRSPLYGVAPAIACGSFLKDLQWSASPPKWQYVSPACGAKDHSPALQRWESARNESESRRDGTTYTLGLERNSKTGTRICAQYNSFVATYHVENFGCRATQADGAAIERQLLDRGMERASAAVEAEVVVLNTCTVTASADQDARATVRRIHRENPKAKIFITGCYAQRAPEELSALPGVSFVIGNSHKHRLADYAAPPASNSGFVPL